MKNAVTYGYAKLLSDFMGWLLIGLGFAALIQTFVPPTLLSEYGNGIFAMWVAVVISIPMCMSATASTPVAAGLALDWIVESFQLTIAVSQSKHGDITSLVYSTSAIILTVLMVWQYGGSCMLNNSGQVGHLLSI
jgi:hypothetical protein